MIHGRIKHIIIILDSKSIILASTLLKLNLFKIILVRNLLRKWISKEKNHYKKV